MSCWQGLQDKIISDKASQFTAGEFRRFCETFAIKHITTLAYYFRSNGWVERFEDTLKLTLNKTGDVNNEEKIQQFLWEYWVTPNRRITSNMSSARKIKNWFLTSCYSRSYNKTKAFNVGDMALFQVTLEG